jgi:hypothetical protein
MNKKAIELSIRFLVTIVIALVVFGMGIYFVRTLFGGAEEIVSESQSKLDRQIGDLICEHADKACMPISSKTVRRTEDFIFGIKIINVFPGTEKAFAIEVSAGRNLEGQGTIPKPLIAPEKLIIKSKEGVSKGMMVQVPSDTPSGRYVFDVTVLYNSNPNEDPQDEYEKLKFYVTVP